MKKIFINLFVILAISSISFAFAANAEKNNSASDILNLTLDAKLFAGSSAGETAANIDKLVSQIKKIKGLKNVAVASVVDNNGHGSITVNKKDYKKTLDKRGVEQLKKELESDTLVKQIWVWYSEIYIKFKTRIYSREISEFLARHPDLVFKIPASFNEIKDISVSLDGIPIGKASQYKELIKGKFADQIKKID